MTIFMLIDTTFEGHERNMIINVAQIVRVLMVRCLIVSDKKVTIATIIRLTIATTIARLASSTGANDMTTAIQSIMNQLAEVFAPMDAEVEAASQEWAKGRIAALKAYDASEEYQNDRKQKDASWIIYPKRFAIAGGKTWYNIFNGYNVAEFITKNCAATAEKRNAAIARKLSKAGVTDVLKSEFTRTNDGFNGTFVVETNNGRKVVTVNTIRAGGYNIQCLHLRVLTHVR